MKHPLPQKALEQHIIALGKTGSGKSSKLRVLVEQLLTAGDPVCIVDPKGDWWGIKSSADGKSAGFPVVIFGGEHCDVPLNPRAGAEVAELVATGNRPALIDLGGWMIGERTRFFIDFAAAFFRHTRGRRHLVIDEVHNFAPQGKVLDVDAGKMLHWANRLASEGRGKGITLIAASQRPQKVHKDFVTSCETLIACRVIHKLDRDAIKDWIDGCADPVKGREVLQQLATMARAEAWVWSPEIEFGPQRIEWPMFTTYDSFKPQDAQTAKLKGWAEVDLEEVRGKLQSVVAEAEANDPKKLRATIVKLEQQIRTSASSIDPGELDRAQRRAYERGVEAAHLGYMRMLETGARFMKATLAQLSADVEKMFHEIRPIHTKDFTPGKTPVPPGVESLPERVVLGAGGLTRSRMPAPPRANGSGEKLSKAERLVLTALAQYPDGRTKVQVALLSGYAHTGGGFNNALSALRGRACIADHGDKLLITPAGETALGPFDPLPTGQELLRHWLGQLSKAEREILEVLAKEYPRELSKDELAAETPTGYEPNGGGFNNALSRLRTLELISGRGALRASEDLF